MQSNSDQGKWTLGTLKNPGLCSIEENSGVVRLHVCTLKDVCCKVIKKKMQVLFLRDRKLDIFVSSF